MSKQLIIPGFPAPKEPSLKSQPPSFNPSTYPHQPFRPFEQCISIQPEYYTLFNDLSDIKHRKISLSGKPVNQVQRILNTGTMSRGASSKMKRAINYLFLISKEKKVYNTNASYFFKMKQSFITLTLSDKQKHPDNWIKKHMLKNFIDTMRNPYPGLSYVWKAETQVNGNLHFHIITDHFIPFEYVNKVWNRIQYKHGYLDKYMNKNHSMKAPSAEIRKVKGEAEMKQYIRKYMLKGVSRLTPAEINAKIDSIKNRIPFISNPTEVTKLQHNLSALYKELNERKKRKVQGKLWGCSDNLLLKPYVVWVNALTTESKQTLFENEVLVESNYFQVFKMPSFKNFIQRLAPSDYHPIRDYFLQLFSKIKIPAILYKTNSNYSYRAT